MPIEQYTYWSVTINNPDENDYLIVRNPNEKYIRSLVWTPEVGEQEETPHIQAWVRLQRNQSLAFVRKLYPRAHLKPVDKDVYNENCHQYAQKNDDTTNGNHHIMINDPLPANDTLLYSVLRKSFELRMEEDPRTRDLIQNESMKSALYDMTLKRLCTASVESRMVQEKAGLEKIFCSPAYERMKVKFWREILFRLFITQTEDARSTSGNSKESRQEERSPSRNSEDYEDDTCSTDEGQSTGGSSCSSEEDASTEY